MHSQSKRKILVLLGASNKAHSNLQNFKAMKLMFFPDITRIMHTDNVNQRQRCEKGLAGPKVVFTCDCDGDHSIHKSLM